MPYTRKSHGIQHALCALEQPTGKQQTQNFNTNSDDNKKEKCHLVEEVFNCFYSICSGMLPRTHIFSLATSLWHYLYYLLLSYLTCALGLSCSTSGALVLSFKYTCLHTYVHTYTYTYIYVNVCACACACACVCACKYCHVHKIYIHTCVYVCMCIYVYTYVYTDKCACKHTYHVFMYICTPHIHKYTLENAGTRNSRSPSYLHMYAQIYIYLYKDIRMYTYAYHV